MELIKNGFHIHFIHAALHHITKNTYLSATIAIKLYSLNYFYWYGHLYSYLPKHNWIKQFIRFTDTGHVASFALCLPAVLPAFLPIAHNVHFIIMAGYWLGKLAFNLKDADRMAFDKDTNDIIEWHMDLCTYIHHTVPYMLIIMLLRENHTVCEYNYTLLYTYGWVYTWFICVYLPWRMYTGDTVYSILDVKQTPTKVMLGFVGFIHVLVWLSNVVGYSICISMP